DKLWADFLLGAAHREVARFWQDVNSFRHLRIASRDQDPVSHHTTIRRIDNVEPQHTFEKRTIPINHSRRHLERRIREHVTAKCFEHRVRYRELLSLPLVTEIDAANDPARLKTMNPAIHQVAGKHKNRTRQATLRQVYRDRINALT